MNSLRFLIIFFLFLMGSVILHEMQKPNPSPFVAVKGQDFYTQDKQFRSVGVNRYNLLTYTKSKGEHIGCANSFSKQQLDTVFANMHAMGVTTVRFWAFQSFTKSGNDMDRMDYVVDLATQYNIKLIPVLENHWQDCTEHDVKPASWYADGYKNPYGAYPLAFKEYISKIVPRYKDNPTIFAWEIINEPRDVSEDVLTAFTSDISQHIKSIDKNHLVSIGMAGGYHSSVLYESVYGLQTIDYVDYHDYDFENETLPDPMTARAALAKKLNKPFVIGESGIRDHAADRAQLFEQKLHAYFQNGGDIYLLWSYGDNYITNDSYNFNPGDEVAQLLSNTSAELKK